ARRGLERVADDHAQIAALDDAGVADLPARLAVERRAVDDDLRLAAVHLRPDDLALGFGGLIAEELGAAELAIELLERVGDRLLLGREVGAVALLVHRAREALFVDEVAALLGDDARQIGGEAVGVVELEDGLARQRRALFELGELLVEEL